MGDQAGRTVRQFTGCSSRLESNTAGPHCTVNSSAKLTETRLRTDGVGGVAVTLSKKDDLHGLAKM